MNSQTLEAPPVTAQAVNAEPRPLPPPRPFRRLKLADRVALRLGVALIVWSRRRTAPGRDELRRRHENALARECRERASLRSALLEQRPR